MRNIVNGIDNEKKIGRRKLTTHFFTRIMCVALVFLSLFASNASAQVQTTCIPYAYGVPALGGAPNWWDTGLNYPYYYNKTDDPRWRGAVSHTYGGGAGEEVVFRALYDSSNLYLSWRADVVPPMQFPIANAVYVGFNPGGGAKDVIVKVTPFNSFANSIVAQQAYNTQTYVRNTTTGNWDLNSSEPAWIANYTRIWLNNTYPYYWAVQMKVPKSSILNSGINYGNTFRLWYELRENTFGGNIKYNWPRGVKTVYNFTKGDDDYPDISTWGNFSLGSGGAGCGEGVSIDAGQIGTLNTPPHAINLTSPNTFFARPFNNMSTTINPNGIFARFRLANWGTQADWNDVPDPSQLWSDIRGGSAVTNTLPIPQGTYGNIQFDWTLNPAEKAPFLSGQKRLHQCMLVELSGPNLTFVRNSVYRNMDFVNASNFSRDAEVSVVGLPSLAAGKRDVYLYVQMKNMPSEVKPIPLPPNRTIWDERSSKMPHTWDSSNFEGFIVGGISTETLTINQANLGYGEGKTRTINRGNLTYRSTRQIKEYEVSRNKGIPIENALDSSGNRSYMDNYYARVNFFGEPYIAVNGDARYLSRLVMEQSASEEKILSKGEAWNLGDGWMLFVKSIESGAKVTTTPAPTPTPTPLNQVMLMLSKDGNVLDIRNVYQGNVYSYSGEKEVPLLVTYIDNVTAGRTANTVKLKYTWAVSPDTLVIPWQDFSDASRVRVPAGFGVFRFISATRDSIYAANFMEISLTTNKVIPLSETLSFKVINDPKYLRFYPVIRKAQTLEDMPAYRVFAYHETDEKIVIQGVSYQVLRPQTSFGYYIATDEDIAGWKTLLQGAQEIAPNFYKLGVPNNSTAKVSSAIETIEAGPKPTPTPYPPPFGIPWRVWVLIVIIILVVIWLAKRKP